MFGSEFITIITLIFQYIYDLELQTLKWRNHIKVSMYAKFELQQAFPALANNEKSGCTTTW